MTPTSTSDGILSGVMRMRPTCSKDTPFISASCRLDQRHTDDYGNWITVGMRRRVSVVLTVHRSVLVVHRSILAVHPSVLVVHQFDCAEV
jgi:hypothetical protein